MPYVLSVKSGSEDMIVRIFTSISVLGKWKGHLIKKINKIVNKKMNKVALFSIKGFKKIMIV